MSESTLATREWDGTTIPQPGNYTLDVAHTRVGFVVKHMMVSKVRGQFGEFDANITVAEDPARSSVAATIKIASVSTGQQGRDDHLRTGDFFEAEKYPEMTFTSTGITGHRGDVFTLAGELTIKDVTQPVELKVELEGVALSPYGHQVFGFTATTEIDREAFGLTYNTTLETGGVMIGKQVKIEIEGEAVAAS
ncbi:polyisoprenoid-binding protein [Actinocatenispora thailandica]|uniref:Polyisoprenoid-binding protein n=1 Tax=Actinocatenispora thailandica TaxID=227318 RepID=A0A7R7DVT6_9ACTN|nr:YceI family protein [Actinocatenispora thailandica]BCJ38761.1 polyisoprenoid-binding protein [Actinocatenispora thailandica]